MGINVIPAPSAASKTMKREMLTSGTSWTVPAGVTYVNVLLVGGGSTAGGAQSGTNPVKGYSGETIRSVVSTTPGSTITYAIGSGGYNGAILYGVGPATGGTTTFAGATDARGGAIGRPTFVDNSIYWATGSYYDSIGPAGNGWIEIEYWV